MFDLSYAIDDVMALKKGKIEHVELDFTGKVILKLVHFLIYLTVISIFAMFCNSIFLRIVK